MSERVTRLRLSSSGGFAGLTFTGELSAEEISLELQKQVVEALEGKRLPAKAPTPAGVADTFQIELSVETEAAEARSFHFDEMAVGPEVVDLVDSIREEMRLLGRWRPGRGGLISEEEPPTAGEEE